MQIWNIPSDIPLDVLETLKNQLKAEIGNTFHEYAEHIGPDQITIDFPSDKLFLLDENHEDILGEVASGLFIVKMSDDKITALMDRVADLIFIALGQSHFVEVFPRILPMKLAGHRQPALILKCPNCDFLLKTSEGENSKCPNCGYVL